MKRIHIQIWMWAACAVLVMMLCAPLCGDELPFSQVVELKSRDDSYHLEKPATIYIKEDATYKTEPRMIIVSIAPTESSYIQGREEKDFFSSISVYIEIKTSDGKISKDFLSYLNFDATAQQLFWDHAGNPTADQAGESFGEDDPLTVEDDYVEITLSLAHLKLSEYRCDGCRSDVNSYIFMDLIRFNVLIEYSAAQKDVIEQYADDMEKYGDAQENVTKAKDFFSQGEFNKAKEEFEKARDIFEQTGDTENINEMQDWIDKCKSYDLATENLKEGKRVLEDASNTEDYKEAIDKYREARSYFVKAKTEFEYVEDSGMTEECDTLIDYCDDEIENLEDVGAMRGRLIYILLAIAVVGGAGILIKQLGKGKSKKKEKPAPRAGGALTLRIRNSDTGHMDSLQVSATDKIGKVRQIAATKLGMVSSALMYQGNVCSPDRTVQECGIADGALVDIVPVGKEPDQKESQDKNEKLSRLEQRYKEGKISKELYESLKRKFEN